MHYDERTALVVVDVQNDFADPDGSLFVTDAPSSIPFVNEQVAVALAAGATVAYTRDWHPEHTPHFLPDGGIWPVHCVAGSWGAEFHPGLDVAEGSIEIHKGAGSADGYSGFSVRDTATGKESPTDLGPLLTDASIERVVVVGLALDYCVLATALDATTLGFATTVLADGTRAVNLAPGDGSRAVATLVGAGVDVI
jgi:nicotinamidase/pyrazinamidase